jgi:hypothetical protein
MANGNGKIVTDARIDKLIANYIAVRNHIKEMKKEQAEFELALQKLAGRLLLFLEHTGQEMARTAAGTVSATEKATASLPDPDVFMEFVVEHRRHDLLNRHANATACLDFAKENGTLPPGVKISRVRSVSVRSATERTES